MPVSRASAGGASHAGSGLSTYVYLFGWESPYADGTLGACHGLEIPFVFGTHRLVPEFAGASAEAFELATLRFSRGLGTQLEVSDAQLARLTAETNEARAIYELHLAAAELARALGRPIPVPGAPAPRSTSTR